MKVLSQWMLTFLFVISTTTTVFADESIDELVSMMGQKLGSYQVLNESVVKGGLRVRLCQYCHGKDGNSVKNNIPNLAEQNPIYLLTQFEYFRNDTRKNKVMNELAKGLTAEERINIALYYASQNVSYPTDANMNSGVFKQGKKVYNNVCINCHGAKGKGQQSLPRVAGQKQAFLISTLTNYKMQRGVRPDSPMLGIAAGLSSEQIKAVSVYVSSLK